MTGLRTIKIYGERNTGTNYFEQLLEQNFEDEILRGVVPQRGIWLLSERMKDIYFTLTAYRNLGWKHSAPDARRIRTFKRIDSLCVITLSKNPYSFLLSLYKRPYNYEGVIPATFSEFIRSRWYVQGRDNAPASYFNTPVELWNYKNRKYLEIRNELPEHCYNMKFERLLEDFQFELVRINDHFMFRKKDKQYVNVEESTKDKSKTYASYRDYYLNQLWINKLSPSDITFINDRIDGGLMNHFEYRVLDPLEAVAT